MNVLGLQIGRQPSGVIGPRPCWYAISPKGYLYLANTFLGLIWALTTEWENDKHLVG